MVQKAKWVKQTFSNKTNLKRAAELGFGVKSAADIQLTPLNDESKESQIESSRF